jgi:hypothetical protein
MFQIAHLFRRVSIPALSLFALMNYSVEACMWCTGVPATDTNVAPPIVCIVTNGPASPVSNCIPCIVYSNRIDRAHRHVSRWVDRTATGLDHFLAGVITDDDAATATNATPEQAILPSKGSYITFSPGMTHDDEDGFGLRGRFKAKVDLPSLKNRVQIIANNIQEDEDAVSSVTDPITRGQMVEGENDKQAGVGIVLVDRMDFDLSLGGGLRFKSEPVGKVKLRARTRYRGEVTLVELSQSGVWEGDDGFGGKTELSMGYNATTQLLLRSTTAAILQEDQAGVHIGETLSFQYQVGPRRSIGVKVGVEWYTEPAAAVNYYYLRFPYRQGLWRDWLYLRIEPGADWENEEDYDLSPLISVGFDIQFGTPRNPPR